MAQKNMGMTMGIMALATAIVSGMAPRTMLIITSSQAVRDRAMARTL